MLSLFLSFAIPLTQLTDLEKKDTQERLAEFYQQPFQSQALDRQGIKIDAKRGSIWDPHPELKGASAKTHHPLWIQAQKKGLSSYRRWYCEKVLKKIDSHFPCDAQFIWSDFQKEDRVSDLVDTWMSDVAYDLDQIPIQGISESPLWSDDFWAMKRGLTSYRYAKGRWYSNYREAVNAYFQPNEWLSFQTLPLDRLNKLILEWSPAEKYDLSIQDPLFSLTNAQKEEGSWYENEEGEVESWMGLCHGWASASIMVPRPEKPVTLPGPEQTSITWYPNDIKAMLTLAWANGQWESNFVGRRCEQKELTTFPNGRIDSQDCFDINPATFHLALGNLVGKAKGSFIMDKAYDYQVWNQPIVAYEFEYFNPLNPEIRDVDWKKVAVDYDDLFKSVDRFQKPLTRGKFLEGRRERDERRFRNFNGSQDGHISKVVGVIATVVYLVESIPPDFGPEPGEDLKSREVYLYDLELMQTESGWEATGGEWLQNNHPDFLFVPKKGKVAQSFWDWLPPDNFLKNAQRASQMNGYPMCSVLKTLVENAAIESGTEYQCPGGIK